MHYRLQDLIDVQQFQSLQDRLNQIYAFPSAIIDNDGNILTATCWQDICTKFHRVNKLSEKECIKSDRYILDHLHEAAPAVSYQCPHGLIDNATPIIIEGVHYGNFFTGQFFLEKPDLSFFREQARKYGFDEASYLDAVKKVPIWTMEQLHSYLFFIKGLIEVISSVGLKKLRETEAKRQIQASEERLRTILQTAMDGFWMVDTQGRILEVNETYCQMSGYREQELLVMRVADLEAVESTDDIAARIQKIVAHGENRFESQHRRKDGSTFDVESSVQYRPIEGGRIVVFLRDITERKQTEEKIKQRERQLSESQRVAKLGNWDLDLVSRKLEWSDQTYRLFDRDPKGYVPSADEFTRLMHPDDRATALAIAAAAFESDATPYHVEARIINDSGREWVMEAFGVVRRDSSGKALGIFGTAQDMSDRKKAENLIQRSLEEKTVLLKEIHHRVKNNMQVIYSLLNLQAKSISDRKTRSLLDEARNRVYSMALIHEKLYGSADLAYIDFKEYLTSLVSGIAKTYKPHDVVLSVDMEPLTLDVNAGIPCGLIVNELVSNSLKYAFPDRKKGTVKVGINRNSEGNHVLFVADNGVGFPEAFDFRNTTSLGLQLVNVLTGQINGKIELSKAEGTAFSITFPGTAENR